jgi:hypothetical protein
MAAEELLLREVLDVAFDSAGIRPEALGDMQNPQRLRDD